MIAASLFLPRRVRGLSLLVAGMLVGALAHGAEPAAPSHPAPLIGRPLSERPRLIVGATTDSYPYGYIGTDGVWTGFGGDLLNAVARVMNLRIERAVLPGRELQEHFRRGEFDFLQSLSQTTDRETYAEFSVPFLTLEGAVFVQAQGSPIKSLQDLNGRKFAFIGAGSIGAQFLRDKGLQVETVLVSSTEEALRLVENGQCAATFASQLTALSVIERAGFHNVKVFGDPIPNYDIRHCFAVHRGDAQLLARLNEGLAILHRTGEFDQIYNKWFGHFTAPLVSRQQVLAYSAVALGVAFLAALWGFLHQRRLRYQITRQTAELAGQQALLQTLYDNIPMAMCVLEAAPAGYRVLSINRQAEPYFGASAAQVAGQPLAGLAPDPEWLAHLAELLQRGLTARNLLREERRLITARKRLIFTLVPMTPDTAGHPRMCVLAEDITEQRNLDEEIAQSRKLRAVGELVGGIAHEFNNLLTPIMLKVGQIQLDWGHDPALLAETRLIAEAVQRSSELTRRLLTFGRKADHPMEEVHLGSIVSNCFSLLRLTMDRRILWEQAVPPDLPPMYFSATDLNQIILNLVINARDTLLEKLAGQRGEWTPLIRVEAALLPAESMGRVDGTPSTRRILGWQRLTIRDNGMGMIPEVRERIFEPFFTTKEVGKGTGLGLATVWHLITEVSGRIEVESTPGVGTAFHLYLPMLPPPAAGATVVPPPRTEVAQARIFLAEDDTLVAGAIIASLKRAGHHVTHLPDGAAAWTHLQEKMDAYDLIVLDVNMPGLDGIELAHRIRATGRYAGRMMITSGRLSSDDLEEIAAAKIDQVLNKPFDIAELLTAVRTCLSPPAKR
jgi:PAS domain S-box-containing protein